MKITWEVQDGYAGKSRPQYLTIDDADLEGLTEEEKEEFIDDYVRQEFESKISFSWRITG